MTSQPRNGTAIEPELPPLPNAWDYAYEWDSPIGIRRSFDYQPHNGVKPDRHVSLFTEEQLREAQRAAIATHVAKAPAAGEVAGDPLWDHKGNVRHEAVDRLRERQRLASLASTPVGEPARETDKAWSCSAGADYLAGKNDVGRCVKWCGDETKCITSKTELPPASSMFRTAGLVHESDGASDYCYHCRIDMTNQGGVNGECPTLKRRYNEMVSAGRIAPFANTATPPAPASHAEPSEPDMRAICEALGFDPTNHHNAAKCPYCRPAPVAVTREPLGSTADVLACVGPIAKSQVQGHELVALFPSKLAALAAREFCIAIVDGIAASPAGAEGAGSDELPGMWEESDLSSGWADRS